MFFQNHIQNIPKLKSAAWFRQKCSARVTGVKLYAHPCAPKHSDRKVVAGPMGLAIKASGSGFKRRVQFKCLASKKREAWASSM